MSQKTYSKRYVNFQIHQLKLHRHIFLNLQHCRVLRQIWAKKSQIEGGHSKEVLSTWSACCETYYHWHEKAGGLHIGRTNRSMYICFYDSSSLHRLKELRNEQIHPNPVNVGWKTIFCENKEQTNHFFHIVLVFQKLTMGDVKEARNVQKSLTL